MVLRNRMGDRQRYIAASELVVVRHLDIHGTLFNKEAPYFVAGYGGTDYEEVLQDIAVASKEAKGIFLTVDSGGGHACGNDKVAKAISQCPKPVFAYTDGMCCSAAYAIASGASYNRRKYQSLTYTSEEKARQPYFDPITLGRLKGAKLAEDVLLDILSVITKENFGDAILTRNAADFDTDDIIDLETKIDELEWPDSPRGMLLKSSYMANVKKDIKTSGGLSTFGFSPLGELPNLMGFSFSKFNRLPDNGEKLQGFIVYPSAIMVALAPIAPTANVMKQLSTYTTYTDPQTGLTFEYRAWGDADTDASKEIIECNYGFGVGEKAALKRIVSE